MSDDSHLTPMQRHQRRWNRLNDSRAVLAICYGARFASIKDYAAIDAHVLAMVGDKDLTTPPAATMAIYRALQRAHGPHTLPGMGHLAIVDAAELVAALLNRFFSKHAGNGYVRWDDEGEGETNGCGGHVYVSSLKVPPPPLSTVPYATLALLSRDVAVAVRVADAGKWAVKNHAKWMVGKILCLFV